MNERVSITIENYVADVRLTRADKMNALDPAMFQGIITAGEELAAMQGVRAVVLSGEGRSFCAGLDMESMTGGGASASGGIKSLTDRTHGNANNFPASGHALAQITHAGHRRGPRCVLWWRSPDCQRRGYSGRCTRCADGGDGDEMGVNSRYGRLRSLAEYGARGRAA